MVLDVDRRQDRIVVEEDPIQVVDRRIVVVVVVDRRIVVVVVEVLHIVAEDHIRIEVLETRILQGVHILVAALL